jgi:hypothetical protein
MSVMGCWVLRSGDEGYQALILISRTPGPAPAMLGQLVGPATSPTPRALRPQMQMAIGMD